MNEENYTSNLMSIRGRVLAVVLGCWLIPFLMMAGLVFSYLRGNQADNYRERLEKQMDFDMDICAERLNYIIALSRSASYEGRIMEAYYDYQHGNSGMTVTVNKFRTYLSGRYSNDDSVQNAILWFWEDRESLRSFSYNTKCGGQYRQIEDFWNEDYEEIAGEAQELMAGIKFVCVNGRYYMIRNLANNQYRFVATLAIRINEAYCFGSLMQFSENGMIHMKLGNGIQMSMQDGKLWELEEASAVFNEDGSYWNGRNLYIQRDRKEREYQMSAVAVLDRRTVMEPVYGYIYVLIGMTVLLIPILMLLFRLVNHHIIEPVQYLMYGAKQVTKGNFGYQLDYKPQNKEFMYLTNSFNTMSEGLKYQFAHIYKRELVLRDARIMALQSHINPHFMNNTLEMINWIALLEGSKKVPPMIRSLSELMNAAMDRKKKPVVPLEEEMRYVKAYLDIMSVRLGDRLSVVNEVKEEHMSLRVPRLIMQPLIENAIEHGVIPNGHGTVRMCSDMQGENLYLDILNEGILTRAEEERVARLLAPDYDTSKEESGSMGIANVNQRLRILYGESCGLRIFSRDDGQVCARICIYVGIIAQK